ncbi:NAD(P)/FAD-dependent oxidoreductase [Mycobacterium sp. 1274761.0]|uniref:flavin-containing monooxygenase n=1 Tax=Mycobacterium sp. 1274761.0 TaxID=1834077 RepID=UPI000AE7E917|nr:NAD(P)/FAD-dependent oxidoreductase [Mycobacterium sp. 1274761.0]
MGAAERVVIVGAGPCGLALARQLKHEQGIDALIVDRATAPVAAWRNRYDGFRLNTCGFWSHLPGQRIPRRHGRWPKRDDMVNYFDDYVRRQKLRLRLGVTVGRLNSHGEGWQVVTDGDSITAEAAIVATGNYHTPMMPSWPGIETFRGELLHSADYRNPWPFAERDVLVVGSGNSATDIAVQLSGGVARSVRMAIRRPPHLVPRAVVGVPVDAFAAVFSRLPVPMLDNAAALAQRAWFGNRRETGLPVPEQGIYTALLDDGHVPTIGDELVRRVEAGAIEIVDAVTALDGARVVLSDGTAMSRMSSSPRRGTVRAWSRWWATSVCSTRPAIHSSTDRRVPHRDCGSSATRNH